jgi:hypothetical protein
MVRPDGIEPPTLGLGVPCSILLSYGRPARLTTDSSSGNAGPAPVTVPMRGY